MVELMMIVQGIYIRLTFLVSKVMICLYIFRADKCLSYANQINNLTPKDSNNNNNSPVLHHCQNKGINKILNYY